MLRGWARPSRTLEAAGRCCWAGPPVVTMQRSLACAPGGQGSTPRPSASSPPLSGIHAFHRAHPSSPTPGGHPRGGLHPRTARSRRAGRAGRAPCLSRSAPATADLPGWRRNLAGFDYGRSEAISDALIVERRLPSAPKRHFDCRSRALIGSEPIFEYGRKSTNSLVLKPLVVGKKPSANSLKRQEKPKRKKTKRF